MKRKILTFCLSAVIFSSAFAQVFVETFDANSLGWTESAGESNSGTAIIDKGVLTITSKGDSKLTRMFSDSAADAERKTTAFETHCYAPLDVEKPFEILVNVTVDNIELDRKAGMIFNYRDFGNYYAFVFNKESVTFLRFVDNRCVGSVSQDIKWGKANKGKRDQQWKLVSEGGSLQFYVDGLEILKIRYMPLEYSGVGFYTLGKQKLVIDDVTFTQK